MSNMLFQFGNARQNSEKSNKYAKQVANRFRKKLDDIQTVEDLGAAERLKKLGFTVVIPKDKD